MLYLTIIDTRAFPLPSARASDNGLTKFISASSVKETASSGVSLLFSSFVRPRDRTKRKCAALTEHCRRKDDLEIMSNVRNSMLPLQLFMNLDTVSVCAVYKSF